MELMFGIGALALLLALAYGTMRTRGNAPVGETRGLRSSTILTVVLGFVAAAAAVYFFTSFFVLDEVNPRSETVSEAMRPG